MCRVTEEKKGPDRNWYRLTSNSTAGTETTRQSEHVLFARLVNIGYMEERFRRILDAVTRFIVIFYVHVFHTTYRPRDKNRHTLIYFHVQYTCVCVCAMSIYMYLVA